MAAQTAPAAEPIRIGNEPNQGGIMPVIHTHVSVKTTPEQREALKAAYGKAITAVPASPRAG